MNQEDMFKILPKKYWPNEYNGELPSERKLHNETVRNFFAKQSFWNIEERIRKQKY